MIRLANIMNGFFGENSINMGYISHDKYPSQNTSYIGKWTLLRYKNEEQNTPGEYYYTANGIDVFEFNGKYYYDDESRVEVPEKDRHGNPIEVIKKFRNPSVNNRFIIDMKDNPELECGNSGEPKLFQILRYDTERPYKVILRSEDNIVIVTTKEKFENIYDLSDSKMYNFAVSLSTRKNKDYISPNSTYDKSLFFDKYNTEYINPYHVQDDTLLGRLVFTEYDTDIYDSELSSDDNKMDLYTLKDKNHDRVIQKDSYYVYSDNQKEIVRDNNFPINEEYNNRFPFTIRMKNHLYMNRSSLRGVPDEVLNSFSSTYNIHSHSFIDTPRRAINKGIIIRADSNGADPFIVVAEYIGDNKIRFVCSDEGRFFFNTDVIGLSVNKIGDIILEREIIK